MEKAKMIKWAKIGGGVLAAIAIITLGYKWYQKRQLAKENEVKPPPPASGASSSPSVSPAPSSSAPSSVATNVAASPSVSIADPLKDAVVFVKTETNRLLPTTYWGGKIKVEAAAKSISNEKAAINLLYDIWITNKQVAANVSKVALLAAV